jgi:hypothetical protein
MNGRPSILLISDRAGNLTVAVAGSQLRTPMHVRRVIPVKTLLTLN